MPSDTIDLHGQFVDEAIQILETRIRAAKSQGQDHLHVIVGKGNHSPGHIQKIKPAVERICQEEGLQYTTEHNEGRMYINLQGGPANMPPMQQWAGGWSGGGYGTQTQQGQQTGAWGQPVQGQYQPHAQPSYGQQHGGYGGQQQHMDQDIQKLEKSAIRACIRACCVVM
jgi:hypothetical protein